MTRGLGNFSLEADGFACLPDVASLPRCEVDFVVVASDGLWDVMSDEDCCALVRGWGSEAWRNGTTADLLTQQARRLGSMDDIAVVVAYFPPEVGLASAGA
mmetsp:Transcript_91995/g.197117  ORF Transcript_91995/g.197117 Transcript_91995/m.197117 type:complete len:101 (-) Transcript_91995:41-343(-)